MFLTNYKDRDIVVKLRSDPRNTYLTMVAYIINDAVFTPYEDEVLSIIEPLLSNFMHLTLRKADAEFSPAKADALIADIMKYRQESYDNYKSHGTKISASTIEIKIAEIMGQHIKFNRNYTFANIEGAWPDVSGPILWTILHITFSHTRDDDIDEEIIQQKSVLLQVLDLFITCSTCREHYKEHFSGMMAILKYHLAKDEVLVVKMHSFITSLLTGKPIDWLQVSPTEDTYIKGYRKLAEKIIA
jgi:hypothetical protein